MKKPTLRPNQISEHVPDFVSWFEEIRAILKPGGTICLAVPDRRFTFDILRAESTLADALDAYLRRARIPLPRAILDHFLNYADIKASDAWAGQIDNVKRAYDPNFAWEAARSTPIWPTIMPLAITDEPSRACSALPPRTQVQAIATSTGVPTFLSPDMERKKRGLVMMQADKDEGLAQQATTLRIADAIHAMSPGGPEERRTEF